MTLEEFALNLLQDLHTESYAEGEYSEDVFFQKCCDQITEAGELETADRVHYKFPTKGIRVDGYGGDPLHSGNALSLIILDLKVSNFVERLTGTEMDTLFRRLSNFLRYALNERWRNSLEETNPVFGLADLIASRWQSISKVRLLLVSNRELSERVDGRPAGNLEERQITYSVWDIRRLYAYASSGVEREDIVIDLENDFGGSLPILPAQNEGQYESYLAMMPGKVLADIYDRWGARLLEQNMRVFLQARGKVNRGIRATLEHDPSMFFAYNNGITVTAEAVELKKVGEQIRLRSLKNFQIVNGGQTTASIHLASIRNVDISQTFVQMKLSVVSAEYATKLVPKISEYANTQNRVSNADFFSNHPFHVRIEEFSRRILAPSPDGSFRQSKWFYERARGQYGDARGYLTDAQRRKFDLENPRRQLFTKTDLAKFVNVWECRPHEVSLGAQKNFAKFAQRVGQSWKNSPDDFNEAWYRQAVAKAITFKETEKIVSSQSWYKLQPGYRANIVAYSIAKFAHETVEQGFVANFEMIWRQQTLGSHTTEALASIAKYVHRILINPKFGVANVTEWAKKEACWELVRKSKIELPSDIEEELISVTEVEEEKRGARRNQRELNGIAAQIAVVNAGGPFWAAARSWGHTRKLLTPKEFDILGVAARVPQNTPTEKQSIEVIKALDKLKEEGYSKELSIDS